MRAFRNGFENAPEYDFKMQRTQNWTGFSWLRQRPLVGSRQNGIAAWDSIT